MFRMDADLLAAVMLQESGGNQWARGRAGEIGLMQIMAKYHRCASWDPRANIFCGASILAVNIQRNSGDVRRALAEYNAGRAGANRGLGWSYADAVLSIYQQRDP